jgi:hypothetical protein
LAEWCEVWNADWKKEPEPGDGKTDPSRKRMTIEVIP